MVWGERGGDDEECCFDCLVVVWWLEKVEWRWGAVIGGGETHNLVGQGI